MSAPTTNRAVVYKKPGQVSIETLPYPTLEVNTKEQTTLWGGPRKLPHGAIIKVVATNICGSDLHMVRGRTPPSSGTILGHEITGEVVEVGRDVEYVKKGDLVSVPFNVACGRCENCIGGFTNICLNVNPEMPGGAYGYVFMGGWPGGQSEYAVVPYADFNLLRIPDKAAAMDKLLDIAYLSDILPTSYYGAMGAGVTTGSSVYIAGAGPVGLCAAACCLQLLGAGPVIVGDYNEARLKQARNMGCETVLLEPPSEKSITGAVKTALLGGSPLTDKIQSVTGDKYVDCAIDCAGFETNGLRRHSPEDRSSALNDTFTAVKFGGKIGVPGLYPLQDTGADDAYGKKGGQQLDFGKFWNKGAQMTTGQCPVSRYNRYLLDAILAGKLHVAEYLNTTVISLDEAPKAYKMFDEGIARKFVIDPHGMIPEKAKRNAKALSLDA